MVALLRTTLGLRVPERVQQSSQEFTSLSAGFGKRLDNARINARAFDRATLGDLFLCLRHQFLPSQHLRARLPTLEDNIETAVARCSPRSHSPRNSGECDADFWQGESHGTEQAKCHNDR